MSATTVDSRDTHAVAAGAASRLRLGIDLGGTKIEVIALDAAGIERFRRRVATPRDNYAATLDSVVRLVADAERSLGATGLATVGVGRMACPSVSL